MNGDQTMKVAKIICKSIDALTREIHLLREDLGIEIETSIDLELEEEPSEVRWADGTRIPPTPNGDIPASSTGRG